MRRGRLWPHETMRTASYRWPSGGVLLGIRSKAARSRSVVSDPGNPRVGRAVIRTCSLRQPPDFGPQGQREGGGRRL